MTSSSPLGGRAARAARLARLSTRAGGGLWSARRHSHGGDLGAAADAHADVAEAVFDILGSMKGAAMKLGQLLSYVDVDLDPRLTEVYRARLAGLVDSAPATDTSTVEKVVAAELGAPVNQAFARWDRQPLAVASIGQVHRARLHSGAEVVVKVQHPGIAEAIEADLANVDTLARMVRLVAPEVDPRDLLVELRERVLAELDYQQEARYQQAFVERYAGHPSIRVPRVHHELCRPRVLVSDFVEGESFAEMRQRASRAERDRYGEILFRFVFGSLYRFRIFNSDPHPGNFLFPGDGTVAFLDFGSARTFSAGARQRLQAVHQAVAAGDPGVLGQAMRAAGLLPADSAADLGIVLDWFRLLREPMMVDAPYTYTPDYARRVISASAGRDSPYRSTLHQLAMPAEYLLLNRITFGVNSLLARLEPTACWHRIMRELSEGSPPATPLGEAEAAFLSGHRHVA